VALHQTFLFADLAGFTALTEAHGDEPAADVAGEFFACVRALLERHEAEEVKTIGDAVMIRAESAAAAIQLGLDIVEAVEARDRFPMVRVGMCTGRAVERDGDWFGSTVNVAARISGAAAGCEVLVTEATRAAAGEPEGVQFQRHGEVRFRNVADAVLVHRAVRSGRRAGELPIDPVCRMTIAPNASAGRLAHDGVEYQFCSLDCAAKFAADPDRYLA
jgi:class 3 adenylate cyclase